MIPMDALMVVACIDKFHVLLFFSIDWRFVAIDFPGHGLSSHRSAGCFYPFTLYVADIRRVVEGLKTIRTILTNKL